MREKTDREELRQIYQQKDDSNKTYIPAKPKIDPYSKDRFFRACAYCRVSTDSDEQLSSYELQQSHYKHLASEHSNWKLLHIYADEGISGTSLKKRDEFNQMIEACKNGEYDLILTKSVSRFARNIVDCISLVRMLMNLNPPVGVYFETDNLFTLDKSKEFMLTFLASFAQEESVKKSESMIWSLTQRFKDGKLLTPAPLGYDRPRDVTGRYIKYAPLEINEPEARIVNFIYDAYLYGWTRQHIANFLTEIGCNTKTGNPEWTSSAIKYILTNERYCGDVLTWKTFTSDMFEHKHKRNRQDRDQYLYKNHHPAIVAEEKFESVQVLIENRRHNSFATLPALDVIRGGIFRGYLPINHRWINEDPKIYYDISNSVSSQTRKKRIEKKTISAFNLDGYQVVRNQFTQIRYEGPAITIVDGRITFNLFCMRKFEDVGYIQLLLHPAERKVAIRPCDKEDVHSIKWRPDADKRLYSKTLSCKCFGTALYSIMDWNPDYVYKIRGIWAKNRDKQIIIFDLTNAMPAVWLDNESDGRKRKRVNLCPDEWIDGFGEEFYEHVIDNEYYYLSSKADWQSDSKRIHAPGFKQFDIPDVQDMNERISLLIKGVKKEENA